MGRVCILLSTYNGEKYLSQQLESLYAQTYKDTTIIARDDGSRDKTRAILQEYGVKVLDDRVNVGVVGSFSKLLTNAIRTSDCEYFMFCDQDDVWLEDKVEKTLHKMRQMQERHPKTPLLVHSDLEVVDENLQPICESFWRYEGIDPATNDFSRLLMQNTVTGCTMMMSRDLAKLSSPIPEGVAVHDWWLALVASKFGRIGFIREPLMRYRQHGKNSVGAQQFSILQVLQKARMVFYKQGYYLAKLQPSYDIAQAFALRFDNKTDKRTKEMLEQLNNLSKYDFFQKRAILLQYKLFKQGFMRNLGMFLKI